MSGNPLSDKIVSEIKRLRAELSAARANARILAHAYTTDNRPPSDVVIASLNYPIDSSIE